MGTVPNIVNKENMIINVNYFIITMLKMHLVCGNYDI